MLDSSQWNTNNFGNSRISKAHLTEESFIHEKNSADKRRSATNDGVQGFGKIEKE